MVESSHRHHGPGSLESDIEALVACGALAPRSPVIDDALAVADALENYYGRPAATARVLPEPWQSLIARRGRGGGPHGSLLVAAVTPVFDGVSAAFAELRSNDDGFELDAQLAGAGMAGPFRPELEQARITFTAKDDCGNHYLGGLGSFSGGEDSMQGQVDFWPALDPVATRLDVALTADRSRAVIHIPLRWSERS